MTKKQDPILLRIISLIKSSENKYKQKNFKGSLEDKLEIKSLINGELSSNEEIMNKYKKELSSLYSSKFDLIKDHKMKIDDKKRNEIIKLLEKNVKKNL